MPWRAILEGADADAAREAVAKIGGELAGRELDDASLAYGAAGIALTHGYLARADQPEAADRAHAALARALALVDERPPAIWLGTGLAGVAWVMHHLRDVIACDDATLDQVDDIVADRVARAAPATSFEHWFGWGGLGIYALERGRLEIVEGVVARLARLAEPADGGVVWRRNDKPEQAPHGYLDVGMAHGIAGVAAFLIAAHTAGIAPAGELARGAAHWLAARDRPDARPRFPMTVGRELPADTVRNGWCYGDAAIAMTLARAGAAFDEPTWSGLAHELAVAAANMAMEHVPVFDAGLCHGAASRAHLLHHLARAFDDARLAEAARGYYRETLARLDATDDPSLLVGTAGIALVLLAAVSTDEPGWERLFLLDAPRASS